jgi:hypothetical protein
LQAELQKIYSKKSTQNLVFLWALYHTSSHFTTKPAKITHPPTPLIHFLAGGAWRLQSDGVSVVVVGDPRHL